MREKWTKRKISTITPARFINCMARPCTAFAADRVLEEMHLHSGPGPLRESGGESVGDLAFLPKEILERDRALRGTNRLEHRGKNLIAILQRGNLVSLDQRRPEQMADRASENFASHVVIGLDRMPNFFLRRKKIPRQKERDQTADRGRAEELGPRRRLAPKRRLHCICIEARVLFDPLSTRPSGARGPPHSRPPMTRAPALLAFDSDSLD